MLTGACQFGHGVDGFGINFIHSGLCHVSETGHKHRRNRLFPDVCDLVPKARRTNVFYESFESESAYFLGRRRRLARVIHHHHRKPGKQIDVRYFSTTSYAARRKTQARDRDGVVWSNGCGLNAQPSTDASPTTVVVTCHPVL